MARPRCRVRVAGTRPGPPPRASLVAALPNGRIVAGECSEATFDAVDPIAISPGIARNHPAIRVAVEAGAALVGDIELFARALPADQKVLAVTGTNGKSTVTSLTGALTRAAGLSSSDAGNIRHAVPDALEPSEPGAPWPAVFVLGLPTSQPETTTTPPPLAPPRRRLRGGKHGHRHGDGDVRHWIQQSGWAVNRVS